MQKLPFRFIFTLLAILILLASVYNTFTIARHTSDENLYANQKRGVIFIQITPGGVSDDAGLRLGDRLVKINGVDITSAAQAQGFLDRAKPGDSLTYTIERDGRIFDIRVNLALAGVRLWQMALFITGFFFILYGLFLILSRPTDGKARLVALATMMLAWLFMNIQVAPNIPERHLLYRVYGILLIVNASFLLAVFLHATLYFPTRKYEYISRFRMIYLHYLVAAFIAVYAVYRVASGLIYPPILLLFAVAYVVVFELVHFKKRRREFKARSRVFLWLLAVMLAVFMAGFMIQIVSPAAGFVEAFSFAMVLLPLSFFYTTIKYRVFDISVRVRLSIVYTTVRIVLLFLFAVAILMLVRWLSEWSVDLPGVFITGTSIEIRDTGTLPQDLQVQVQRGYLILFGIVLTALLHWLRNRLQTVFERLFFQQKYDYRRALKNLVEILSASFRRDEISQRSVDQITGIMRIKGAMLLLSENGRFRVHNATGSLGQLKNRTFEFEDSVLKPLQAKKAAIKQQDLHHFPPLSELDTLIFQGIPIVSGGNMLEGLLFTGEKLSESPYNTEDLELLDVFADHLGSAFERARLYQEMADKERIQREIEIARDIQLKSLPHREPDYPGLDICASLSAAAEVGGDYYDYIQLDRHRLGIIVGDVVGKGTSAAFHMSKIQGFVRSLAQEGQKPDRMLIRLNGLIKDNFDPDFFCTALYGIFDTGKSELALFRLGHTGLIHFDAHTGKTRLLEPSGLGLGIGNSTQFSDNLESTTIGYHTGDLFVFLTDGFTEAMNEQHQPFGEENLCRIIRESAELPAAGLMNRLVDAVRIYSNDQWFDDATSVIVKIK